MKAIDRFPWLAHAPPLRERRPGAFLRAVALLVLFTQFWTPILAQAQVPVVPNYPVRDIPPAPDVPRRAIPLNMINTPAKVPGDRGYVPPAATGEIVGDQNNPGHAKEAQYEQIMKDTIGRAQRKPTNVIDNPQFQRQPSSAAGNLSDAPAAGNPQINIKEIIPGSTGDTILYDTLNSNPDLIKGAARQTKYNINQTGCRTTVFQMVPDATGGYSYSQLLAIFPQSVTLRQIAPGDTTNYPHTRLVDRIRYEEIRAYSGEAYNGALTLDFPTLGRDQITTKVIRAPTPTMAGFELEFRVTPYVAPADDTYFTYNPWISSGLTGTFSTLGGTGDRFRWRGTFNYVGGYATVWGILYNASRSYSGTVIPPTGCPPDPSGNPFWGVDLQAPMSTGILALLNQPRSAPQDAVKNLNDSAWKPHPQRYDPDMTAVFNSSETLNNNSSPVYNEIFSGCSISTSLPGSNSTTTHKADIYHCQNLRNKAFDPNGCDGQRIFNFATGYPNHEVLRVQIVKRTPWPRPAPTCNAPVDVLTGDWIDPMASSHNWLCTPPPVPPTCNAGDTLSGTNPSTWLCTRPDTTSYVPVIPFQPQPYVPTIPEPYVYTDVPVTWSGAFPVLHELPLIGGGGGWTQGPDANGYLFIHTFGSMPGPTASVFPWNVRLAIPSGPGTVSDSTLISAGTPDDGWNIKISGTLNDMNQWSILADVQVVAINQIAFTQPGCEKYVAMMADGYCQPRMLPAPENRIDFTCLEDRNVGGFMDLGSGVAPIAVDYSPAYGGIAKLLVPWGPKETAINNDTGGGPPFVPVPDSCWRAHGGPMDCSFGIGDIPCYTDAQGHQVCGSTDITGMASNFGDPNFIDNCNTPGHTGPPPPSSPPLFSDTQRCARVNGPQQICAPSGSGIYSNVCYVYDVSYDCGPNLVIENPVGSVPPTVQQCGATPIRCMGTECHNPPTEANTEFNEAVAAASTVDAMASDMACADGTEFTVDAGGNTPPGCVIRIFPGKWMWCKVPIGNQIGLTPNCCAQGDEASAGVDPAIYLKAVMVAEKISNIPIVAEALAGVPGYTGLIESFQTMSSAISGAANSTMSFISNEFAALSNQIAGNVGQWTVNSYSAAVTDALPSVATETGIISAFTQQLWSAAYDILSAALGPEIAAMFVAGAGGTTVTVGAGTTAETTMTVAGFSAGPILVWIGYAYLAYAVLQIIGNIVFACEEDELLLGIQRKVGNCHDVGGYCKTKAFLVGCVEWRNSSCCYKTPLSRIINEQIRAQLMPWDPYKGYGDPKQPNCEGLTLQQISSANWDAIDLSEWVSRMQDAGLIAKNATDAETMYPLGANTYNTVLGLQTPPQTDYVQNTLNNLGSLTSEITTRRIDLAGQPVCYQDPTKMPWYAGEPVKPGDVLTMVGGQGSVTSCGEGCIELTLGKNQYHAYCANGDHDQQFGINVLRPELLTSGYISEATWDDHLQISIGGSAIYTSPSFYVGGELSTTWCLTSTTTPPVGSNPSESVCYWPSNVPNGGYPAPGIDVLSGSNPVASSRPAPSSRRSAAAMVLPRCA